MKAHRKSPIFKKLKSCLACVYRVMDAPGKFGEHERSVRVARGAEIIKNFNNKVFPPGVVVGSVVQTSQREKN